MCGGTRDPRHRAGLVTVLAVALVAVSLLPVAVADDDPHLTILDNGDTHATNCFSDTSEDETTRARYTFCPESFSASSCDVELTLQVEGDLPLIQYDYDMSWADDESNGDSKSDTFRGPNTVTWTIDHTLSDETTMIWDADIERSFSDAASVHGDWRCNV